jgi:GABA permease
MRNPLRSEAEAFRFTLIVVGLGVVVALAGILGGGWVALGVFLGLALGGSLGWWIRSKPEPAAPAIWAHRPSERRRILVVANETLAGRALVDEVRYRARGYDAEVRVVAPSLNSPLRTWTSDVDAAMREARERLDASLGALLAAGVDARGEIGDGDPLQAIEDGLRTFDADELIVSTHPPGRSNWLERDVVAKARERFDLPITHVVVDLEHERATVERV